MFYTSLFAGLGYTLVLRSLISGPSYMVIISYSIHYIYNSLASIGSEVRTTPFQYLWNLGDFLFIIIFHLFVLIFLAMEWMPQLRFIFHFFYRFPGPCAPREKTQIPTATRLGGKCRVHTTLTSAPSPQTAPWPPKTLLWCTGGT